MNQSINTDSKNSKEPQQKYRRQYKNTGGLKPVLWAPNLALSFCCMTRIIGTKMWNTKQNI